MLDVLKAVLLGIIEGITEWLPISSTGHLILADEFIKLGMSDAFKEMFDVVIQLGAILAVVVLFWNKLWPFGLKRNHSEMAFTLGNVGIKKNSLFIWVRVILASVPAAVIGLPFDDKINEIFFNPTVVSIALIFYGVAFIVIEKLNKNRAFKTESVYEMSIKTALIIGCFQVLSLIPGTSRSGSTIIGAMLIGTSRTAAAEFSFFLSVPVMLGASFLKLLKFGFSFTAIEAIVLLVGTLTAFLVSMVAIKFLMNFVKKHSFSVFGWYRIVLGLLVLGYFYLV